VNEDRFAMEPGEVRRPGDQVPVLSTRDLLIVLGVHRASEEAKRAAVAEWLSDHDPEPLLRAALERSGYLSGSPRRSTG
jgi:hypothetical protein